MLCKPTRRWNPSEIEYDPKEFEPDGVFGSRGIREDVAKARPHVPYRQGDWQTVTDAEWWRGQLNAEDKRTIVDRVGRAPGILMVRHAAEIVGRASRPVAPEIRPAWAIYTGEPPTWHDHEKDLGPVSRAEHVMRSKVTPDDLARGGWSAPRLVAKGFGDGADHFGNDREGRHYHVNVARYLFTAQPKVWIAAPDRPPHKHEDYKTRQALLKHIQRWHYTYRGRRGRRYFAWGRVELEETHQHTGRPSHKHCEYKTESGLRNHVARWHYLPTLGRKEMRAANLPDGSRMIRMDDGRDMRLWFLNHPEDPKATSGPQPGRVAPDDMHTHYRLVSSRDDPLAMRLDVHPMAVKRLVAARKNRGRTFLALEGCLKSDSILSCDEAVFSVPSVSLWDAPELRDFAELWLKDVTVFVVCDSDWERENDDSVIRQSILCRNAIRRYAGHERVYIAAPPPATCEQHGPGTKADGKHGVDDFLAEGGSVDDLVVVEREARFGYIEWLSEQAKDGRQAIDGRELRHVKRDAAVLGWLVLIALPNGRTIVSEKTIAENLMEEMGAESLQAARQTVSRAIGSLYRRGAIKLPDGPLSFRKPRTWMKGDWVGVIEVADELKADTRKDRRVHGFRR